MSFHSNPWTSAAIGLAVWFTILSLSPLITNGGYQLGVAYLSAIVGAVGVVGGLIRLHRLIVLLGQAIALGASVIFQGLSAADQLGLVLDGQPLQRLYAVGVVATESIQSQSAPVASNQAVDWLLVLAAGLIITICELLANGLEQPAWTIVPLLTPYVMPALLLAEDNQPLSAALIAFGYLLILISSIQLPGGDQSRNKQQAAWYELSRTLVALVIGIAAFLSALAVAPHIPMGEKRPWLPPQQTEPIRLEDPFISLNEDLNRPEPQLVLTYQTSTEQSTYLRLTALPRISDSGAQLLSMTLQPIGLAGIAVPEGDSLTTNVQAVRKPVFLPAPYAPKSVQADGYWSYDPETFAIISIGSSSVDPSTGLDYQVTSQVANLTLAELTKATAGQGLAAAELLLDVPDSIRPEVIELTKQLTADSPTAGGKALAIQEYLRSAEFSYSLKAPRATDMDTISAFLLESKEGYCVHYATAMAVMARIVGIPSRVVVGYTGGKAVAEGFEVTTDNAHAWPELYFAEYGWLAFEPTGAVGEMPGYTSVTPTPTPTPANASPSPSASPNQPSPSPDPTKSIVALVGQWWWQLPLVLLLLVAVAALPGLVRFSQRQHRLLRGHPSDVAAAGAWAEVRATLLDRGISWPESSPLLAAEQLAEQLPEDATAPLLEIASIVERVRYSRQGAATKDLPKLVRRLRTAMPEQGRQRFLLEMAPKSLWHTVKSKFLLS